MLRERQSQILFFTLLKGVSSWGGGEWGTEDPGVTLCQPQNSGLGPVLPQTFLPLNLNF